MEKERKLQIIRAALKRFIKHGIKKTTLDEVARDLRIGKATLYHYFKSKEDLYYNSLRFEIEQFLSELKTAFSQPESSLSDHLNSYFQVKEYFHIKYKLIYELILHVLNQTDYMNEKEIYFDLLNSEKELLKELLKGNIKRKEISPEAAAEYLISQGWYFVFNENFRLNDLAGIQIKSNTTVYISGSI